MNASEKLIQGPCFKALLVFTLPYLLARFLQTLYGMADLYFAGRFCALETVNGVSVGAQFMYSLTVVFIGLAMGTTVLTAHLCGEKKLEEINKTIGNSCLFFLVISLIFMIGLMLCCNWIIAIMQTPAASIAECRKYLMICFAGLPFICFYNVFCSVFRGLGDSVSPMIFVGITCVINIVLDWLFIGSFGLQAAGAALATVISQGISAIMALFWLLKKNFGFRIKIFPVQPSFITMKELVSLGAPVAIQDGFIQGSFLVIAAFANSRGLIFSTAVGVVEKAIGIFFQVPSSFLASLSAITATNMGAGKPDRAITMLQDALISVSLFGILSIIVCWLIPEQVVSIFVQDSAVIAAGALYLKSYSFDVLFAGIHFCFSGFFTGIQKPTLSFIHNLISVLLIRIPGAWLATLLYPESLFPMGLAAPLGSLLSVIVCLGFYYWIRHHSKTWIWTAAEAS